MMATKKLKSCSKAHTCRVKLVALGRRSHTWLQEASMFGDDERLYCHVNLLQLLLLLLPRLPLLSSVAAG